MKEIVCVCGHVESEHYQYILNGKQRGRCKGCDPFKNRNGGDFEIISGSIEDVMYRNADHDLTPAPTAGNKGEK